MKNAVIGVILSGFAAWVGLAYLDVVSGPKPWDFLPAAVRESEYGWIMVLGAVAVIWLIWDRFSVGK